MPWSSHSITWWLYCIIQCCVACSLYLKQAKKDGKDDIDVGAIMNTWILQMGYPVVHLNYERSSGKVTMTQEHFLLDRTLNVTEPSDYKYVSNAQIQH